MSTRGRWAAVRGNAVQKRRERVTQPGNPLSTAAPSGRFDAIVLRQQGSGGDRQRDRRGLVRGPVVRAVQAERIGSQSRQAAPRSRRRLAGRSKGSREVSRPMPPDLLHRAEHSGLDLRVIAIRHRAAVTCSLRAAIEWRRASFSTLKAVAWSTRARRSSAFCWRSSVISSCCC